MTTRTLTQRLVVLLAVQFAAAATPGRADGYRNPPESASAVGRIGGKIADTDDASAATINPANLTRATKADAMLSTTVGYAKRQFTGPGGVEEESTDPWGLLPSAYGVLPLADGQYVLGVGLTVPFGRASTWDDTVSFAQASPYFAELYVVNANPSIATRLTESLSAALGVSAYASRLEFKQKYPWAAITRNGADPAGDARFKGDGDAFGFNAALSWDIVKGHRVGLTYRSPFDVDYDGDFSVTELPPAAAAAGATARSDFSTKIKYPSVVGLGYSLPVAKSVRLELDAEFVEHSRNQNLPIDIGANSFLLPSTSIPQGWDDNWTYGVGLAWECAEAWTLRTGAIYLETPSPTSTLLPVGSEEDQSVVSIGCAYHHNAHRVDLAYAMGIFGGRDVTDNVNPAVNGHYDTESHLLSVAYAHTF